MSTPLRRLIAFVLDTGFIAVLLGFLMYINLSSARSAIFTVVLAVFWLLYKPFMEFYYGATLGKMITQIRVVNRSLRIVPLPGTLLRNCIFYIAPLGLLPFLLFALSDQQIQNAASVSAFVQAALVKFPQFRVVIVIQLIVFAVDGAFLLYHRTREQLSLKDILASTRVVTT